MMRDSIERIRRARSQTSPSNVVGHAAYDEALDAMTDVVLTALEVAEQRAALSRLPERRSVLIECTCDTDQADPALHDRTCAYRAFSLVQEYAKG